MLRRACAATTLALALTGLLTGCGGDDTGDAAGEPDTTVTVTETPSDEATTESPSADPTASATDATDTTAAPPSTAPTLPDVIDAPTSYDETTELIATAKAAGSSVSDLKRFETTGGIYCALSVAYLPGSCELASGMIRDTSVCGTDGPSQRVGRIEFDDSGWVPVCNTDTIREPGATKVVMGDVIESSALGFQCIVTASGVACVAPAISQSFYLGNGQYDIFTG